MGVVAGNVAGVVENSEGKGWVAFPFFYAPRACLKIEEMPDFWSKGGDFKEKTARNTCVLRGFSTQKATALGQKDGVFDFSNEP